MAEPEHVHRVFRVVSELLDELRAIDVALAAFTCQPISLRFEVPRNRRPACLDANAGASC